MAQKMSYLSNLTNKAGKPKTASRVGKAKFSMRWEQN